MTTCCSARRSARLWGVLRVTLMTSLLGLTACAVGPDFHTPTITTAEKFRHGVGGETTAPIAAFWRRFNDAELNALIDQALQANHDVRIAVANLREARAAQREVDANALPLVSTGMTGERQVQPQTQRPNTTRAARTQNVYDLNLDVSWEANFFGRYARGSEAAQATVGAVEAHRDAVQLSVAAEVARHYFELRGTEMQLEIARRIERNQTEVWQLTEKRFKVGRGTELDVARARSLVENTRADIPALEASIVRSRYRLGVLTAQPPDSLGMIARGEATLPGLTVTQLATGTPRELLRRRPDVRLAERQLAAATARVGVATSELYPNLSFNGGLGLNASRLASLTDSLAFTYNIGASLVWTMVDFGRLRARVMQAEARADAALAQFEKTVLLALEETETALEQFNRLQQQTDFLFKAVQASARAAELARIRFDMGATDFLSVLAAEDQLWLDQNRLVSTQTRAAIALVGVYKALAGGW